MKNKELQEKLKEFPDDAEVWIGKHNKYVDTYAVVDYVFSDSYFQFSNDFFGTPGRMDKRLFENHKDDDTVVYIGSKFGSWPCEEVDWGDDDINEDIRLINGEGGDEDLVWHQNDFKWNSDIECYIRQWYDENSNLKYEITYHKPSNTLYVSNLEKHITGSGVMVGSEDIRKMIEACQIEEFLYYI